MEFNVKKKKKKKSHVLEIRKSAMRPSWTYKLGKKYYFNSKEDRDLGVVIQDNLSPEKTYR